MKTKRILGLLFLSFIAGFLAAGLCYAYQFFQ